MIMSRKSHRQINFIKAASQTILTLCLICAGSTTKAAWQDDANDRIEQFRKRNALITVVDMTGNPVSDLNVQIEQVNHSFAFGAALSYSNVLSNNTYKNFVLSHFNWAVCENETKWG